jgi:general secretion pathway protein G
MKKHDRNERGFTLIELLVVLAILGLLAAIVGPQVIRYLGSSRTQTAQIQTKNIAAALELFKLDAGRYPTGEADVYSFGSDGAAGGTGEAKDVGNW